MVRKNFVNLNVLFVYVFQENNLEKFENFTVREEKWND